MPDHSTPSCVTCGTALLGPFCHACGEKRRVPSSLDLRPFLHEVFHFETHLDNTLVRTLKPLFTQPGRLTQAWIEGCRMAYAKPIQLFVVLNLLFFLIAPHLGLFGWKLEPLLRDAPMSEVATLAHKVAEVKELPLRVVAFLTDKGLDGVKRSLFLVLIPCVALLLKLLRPRRRMVEHLVFAIHYACFVFVLILVLTMVLALFLIMQGVMNQGLGDTVMVPLFLLGMAAYLWTALGRVYGGSGWRRGLEALLLASSFLPLIGAVQWIGFRLVLRGLMH